jgi:uncharacterized protein (TIGR03545 family)
VELLSVVLTIFLVIGGYGYFFVDDHLEWALEATGGQLVGAEVNITDLSTGWITPQMALHGLRVTDPDNPRRNLFEIKEFRASLSLSALLQAKVLVHEAGLNGLRFQTERESPGWVSQTEADSHSMFDYFQSLFTETVQSTATSARLQETLGVISSSSTEANTDRLLADSRAKGWLETRRKELTALENQYQNKLDSLPNKDELKELGANFESLISNQNESTTSRVKALRRVRSLLDKLKTWKRNLNSTLNNVDQDFNNIGLNKNELSTALQADIKVLRKKVSIPDVSVENLSNDLFSTFLQQQLGPVYGLYERAKPYLASQQSSDEESKSSDEPSETTGVTEERIGRDYRFTTQNSYPSFLLETLSFSTTGTGKKPQRFEMELNNFTTQPELIDQPMEGFFHMVRPEQTIGEIRGEFRRVANRTVTTTYQFNLSSMNISTWSLINSPSMTLRIDTAIGSLDVSGQFDPDNTQHTLDFRLTSPTYSISTPNETFSRILKNELNRMGPITVQAEGTGSTATGHWTIRSNLAPTLQNSLKSFLTDKIQQIQSRITNRYRESINSQRAKISESMNTIQSNLKKTLKSRLSVADSLENEITTYLKERKGTNKNLESLKKLF